MHEVTDGCEVAPGEAAGPATDGCHPTRRLLLGAAGGLALAASGLLLPEWLRPESVAAEHPLNRLKKRQGRRRTRVRRRKEHRREGERRENDQEQDLRNLGRFFFEPKGIEFQVELASGRPIKVDFYRQDLCSGCDDAAIRWQFTDRQSLARPGRGIPAQTFRTDAFTAAIWIDDRYYIGAQNPAGPVTPWVQLGYGGAFFNDTFTGWQDGTTFKSVDLSEGNSAPAMPVDGYVFNVKRLGDGDDHKVFKVTVDAPA